MHRSMKRYLVTALSVAAFAAPTLARAEGDVTVALTANRVTIEKGKEALQSADQARPGDVIEYRVRYRNESAAAARQLAATLPVPAGLEYLPRTAQPATLLASLDGRTYEPVPLMRRVKLEDGRTVLREVPAADYRYLRWSLGTLASHQERTVRARVRVAPLPPMAASATTH